MHCHAKLLKASLQTAILSLLWGQGLSARAQAIPRPVIPAAVFNITNYGAIGDGRTLNTTAIQQTIDAGSAAGGGTVLVPAGNFVFGPIKLASRINLRLAAGAVLLLTDDRSHYPMSARRYQDGITVADAQDIEISGEGVIDGQGQAWWTAFVADLKADQQTLAHRPYLAKILNCTRVRVSGVTLRNSPMFHLVTQDCTDVTIQDITIQAPFNAANTDGLDPSGWNYLISGCAIDTGDDDIAIKPGRGRTPADKNITVINCTFGHGHGMSIGGGSLNGLEDLTVSNCTFTGTDSGIRIKTVRGNGGRLRHLTYENLTMTGVRNPIYINDYYPERNAPKDPATEKAETVGPRTPFCQDVVIRDVTATNCVTAGTIRGLPEAPITGLLLTNVSLSAETGMKLYHVRAVTFADSKIRVQTGDAATTFNAQIEGLAAAEGLPQTQLPVRIQLSALAPGEAIAPGFVGLSFEMQRVLADTNGDHYFRPANRPLIAMFRTLGIKNLRVGGNTADRPTLPTPSRSDVDYLFTFARAAGVKVIYTLRLHEGSLDDATRMADYITRYYSKQLACFAIGNEPNVFSKEYVPYLAEWKRYAAQITAPTNSPGAIFCGPSTSPGHETWSRDFANEFGGHGPLGFIAQHDYPGGDARRATNAVAAREKILAAAMDAHYVKFAANFVPAVISNGLPYRLEEANSFYDGGAADVSDTFASALWALNYQWWWAAHGASGINFHTGDKVAARDENKPCRYAAFWTSTNGNNLHPIGYGLKMFSLGSRGRLLPVTVEQADELNLAVYAAATDARHVWVTLINKEHGPDARPLELTLSPGMARARGEIMFLTAPNDDIATKTGVTLGGAEIQDDATWKGRWTPLSKPGADGAFSVRLPAASAALVQFTTAWRLFPNW